MMLVCSLLCGTTLGVAYDLMRCLAGCGIGPIPAWLQRWKSIICLPRRARPTERRNLGKARAIVQIVARFVFDVCFCLCWAVAMAVLLYCTNDGQLRWSAVVVSLVGFGLYRCTIGRIIRPILLAARVTLLGILGRTVAVLAYPIRRLLGWLRALIRPPLLAIREFYKRCVAYALAWARILKQRLTRHPKASKSEPTSSLADRIRQGGIGKSGFVTGHKR